jgi:hypothetical protein
MVAALEGPDAREGDRVNPFRGWLKMDDLAWAVIRRFHLRLFTVGPCAGPHHAI